jgi:hypothetical protein
MSPLVLISIYTFHEWFLLNKFICKLTREYAEETVCGVQTIY